MLMKSIWILAFGFMMTSTAVEAATDQAHQNNPAYQLRVPNEWNAAWQINLHDFKLTRFRPVYGVNSLYLIDGKRVVQISTHDGKAIWDHTFEHTINSLCPYGDRLYMVKSRFGLMGGKSWLAAYDPQGDKFLWENELGVMTSGILTTDGTNLYTFEQGMLSVYLHAVAFDGKKLWEIDTVGGADNILFHGNRVIVQPANSKKMMAIDPATGKNVWSRKDMAGWSDVSLHGNDVIIASKWVDALNIGSGVKLSALDAMSGEERWSRKSAHGDAVWAREEPYGVTTNGDIGVLMSSQGASAYRMDNGELLWKVEHDKDYEFVKWQKAILLDDKVLVFQVHGDESTRIDLLNLKTGERVWRGEMSDEVLTGIEVHGHHLFMSYRHGTLMSMPLEAGAVN